MKSINQILKGREDLFEIEQVQKLIEYINELESIVIENKQISKYNKEDSLSGLVRDIYSSIVDFKERENENKRFGIDSEIDYKQSINNLKSYIEKFSLDNKFRL